MIVKRAYKQQSGQGCLPICLAYLCEQPITPQFEGLVLQKGLFGLRDSYMLGICQAFMQLYPQNRQLRVVAGSRMHQNWLLARNSPNGPIIECGPINRDWLTNCSVPCIIAIDFWVLGSYVHSPHYVLLVGRTGQYFEVFDPWTGGTSRCHQATLEKGINLLKNHLKFTPVCIQKLQ